MTYIARSAALYLLASALTACSEGAMGVEGEPEHLGTYEAAAQSVNDDDGGGWPISTGYFETLESSFNYTNTSTGVKFPGSNAAGQPEQSLVQNGSFYRNSALANLTVNSASAMPLAEWRIRTRKLGRFYRHLVECALPSAQGATMTVKDTSGAGLPPYSLTATGVFGLAPTWLTSNLNSSVDGQQKVTACLLARMNKFGVPVQISMRSPGMLATSSSEITASPNMEGAFWGNIFADAPTANVCYNSNAAAITASRTSGRECAVGTCSQIQNVGDCNMNNVCAPMNPGSAGYASCFGNTRVVTVFLMNNSMPASDFQVASVSSSALTCSSGLALNGLNTDSNAKILKALCKKSGTDLYTTGAGSATLNFTAGQDALQTPARAQAAYFSSNTAPDPGTRWPGTGNRRVECAPGNYVSSITALNGDVKSVTCSSGNMRDNVCRALPLGERTVSSVYASGNWGASFTQYAECGLGEHISGVAFKGTTTAISGLLCCAD